MPAGVFVDVDDTTADVHVPDPVLRRKIARQLVEAARPEPWRVDVQTVRGAKVFRAPVDVVRAAGLLDEAPPFDEGGIADRLDQLKPDEGVLSAEAIAASSPPITEILARTEPPRTGAGSGTEVWRDHLRRFGIAFDPDDKRAELIARWDAERGDT
ncbi:hypothetical protein [Nocardia cyriacigeorgica]|uniref:hypothetical protein n=1 Tax=Nocardia cyriacigeorgica TaxID=135487 RepID=UPI002456B7B8|nr:hypothetical protein [Nocardia cyriacigeorgica]